MLKTFGAAGLFAAASLSFAGLAHATDFYATPINHGPFVVGGIPIPPVNLVQPFDVVVNSVAGPRAPVAAAEPEMMPKAKRHRMMKKKKMMMKKAM